MHRRAARSLVLFATAVVLIAIGFFAKSAIGTAGTWVALIIGLACAGAGLGVLRYDPRRGITGGR